MTKVYKIVARGAWDAALAVGRFEGAAIDLRDGYIHLSTAAQAAETARLHFAGQGGLVLLKLDAGRLWRGAEVGAVARRPAVPARLRSDRLRAGRGRDRDRARCRRDVPELGEPGGVSGRTSTRSRRPPMSALHTLATRAEELLAPRGRTRRLPRCAQGRPRAAGDRRRPGAGGRPCRPAPAQSGRQVAWPRGSTRTPRSPRAMLGGRVRASSKVRDLVTPRAPGRPSTRARGCFA